MTFFRKAYSVVGVLLLLEYLAQVFLIAATIFTIADAPDNAKGVYAAFKNSDTFAGLHAINGTLVISVTTLILIGLAIGARYPRRTVLLTASLFLLLVLQFVLAIVGIPLVSGLHGLNALVLIGAAGWLTSTHWAWRYRAEARPAATQEPVAAWSPPPPG